MRRSRRKAISKKRIEGEGDYSPCLGAVRFGKEVSQMGATSSRNSEDIAKTVAAEAARGGNEMKRAVELQRTDGDQRDGGNGE